MTPNEQATWDKAVTVYDREFASKDLLLDREDALVLGFRVARRDEREHLGKCEYCQSVLEQFDTYIYPAMINLVVMG